MLFEILGFLLGSAAICAGWMLLWRHEHWKTIRAVYAGRPPRPRGGGNALIWPSR